MQILTRFVLSTIPGALIVAAWIFVEANGAASSHRAVEDAALPAAQGGSIVESAHAGDARFPVGRDGQQTLQSTFNRVQRWLFGDAANAAPVSASENGESADEFHGVGAPTASPAVLAHEAVSAREADNAPRVILAQATEDRQPQSDDRTLSEQASDFFDRFLGSNRDDQRSDRDRADDGTSGSGSGSGTVIGPALDWLDRARRQYREEVVPRLSGGGGFEAKSKPDTRSAQPDIRGGGGRSGSGSGTDTGTDTGTGTGNDTGTGNVVTDTRDWIDRALRGYRGQIVPRLSGGVPETAVTEDERRAAEQREEVGEGDNAEIRRERARLERERIEEESRLERQRVARERREEQARQQAAAERAARERVEAERRRAQELERQRAAAEAERRRQAELERNRQLQLARQQELERQRSERASRLADQQRRAAEARRLAEERAIAEEREIAEDNRLSRREADAARRRAEEDAARLRERRLAQAREEQRLQLEQARRRAVAQEEERKRRRAELLAEFRSLLERGRRMSRDIDGLAVDIAATRDRRQATFETVREARQAQQSAVARARSALTTAPDEETRARLSREADDAEQRLDELRQEMTRARQSAMAFGRITGRVTAEQRRGRSALTTAERAFSSLERAVDPSNRNLDVNRLRRSVARIEAALERARAAIDSVPDDSPTTIATRDGSGRDDASGRTSRRFPSRGDQSRRRSNVDIPERRRGSSRVARRPSDRDSTRRRQTDRFGASPVPTRGRRTASRRGSGDSTTRAGRAAQRRFARGTEDARGASDRDGLGRTAARQRPGPRSAPAPRFRPAKRRRTLRVARARARARKHRLSRKRRHKHRHRTGYRRHSHSHRRRCHRAGRRARLPGRYVVRRGDSLWRIARRHYGRGSKYHRIYRANRRKIRRPNLIFPCQKFRMPSG